MVEAVLAQSATARSWSSRIPWLTTGAPLSPCANVPGDEPRPMISDANVHDILKACRATVSINSSVALEGFLHRKPAVLFGQADSYHFAGRVDQRGRIWRSCSKQIQREDGLSRYRLRRSPVGGAVCSDRRPPIWYDAGADVLERSGLAKRVAGGVTGKGGR